MKYDNLPAFEKHLASSAPNHFSHLYLIMGKEPFECKEAADKLLQALLPQKERHALSIFEGGTLVIQDVLTELNSLSFLSDQRVVWIQQADKLKKEAIEALEPCFNHLHVSQYLILTASTLNKATNFYKKLEKAGVILELVEAKPWEKEKRLIEWLSRQASALRKLIPYPVCQHLVKHVGHDQATLKQEMEKLFCYIGDRNEVTLQDVIAICTHAHVETIWMLGEALFRRDAATALPIFHGLLEEEGQAFFPLLRQIRTQFQVQYQISTMLAQGKQAADITQEFPYMKGQILERNLYFAQHYGMEKFKKGLLAIDAIEIQAKNSQIEDSLLADLLIIKLTE